VSRQNFLRAAAGEGRNTSNQLVAQYSERVDVSSVVDSRVGGRLLRGHIRGGAERDTSRGELLLTRGIAHRLGYAEVSHQGVPPREQHIVRLDVSMHNAAGVGIGEGVSDLDEDLDCVLDRELPVPNESGTQ
jgi:hypothetical protein